MKRALLIIVGILITACFSFYILGANITGDTSIGINEETDASTQTHYLADVNPITPALLINETLMSETPTTETPTLEISTPKSTPIILDGKWKLCWQDEFEKPSVNLEIWTEVDRKDNYNREKQYYTPLNSYIEDGCLYLTARREEKDGKEYTSGMVETRNKLNFLFGRIEARMRLPVGKGFFPAFWLLQNDDEKEIDIMEMVGHEPNLIYAVNHYKKGEHLLKTVGKTDVAAPEQFHVYALEWEEDELRWYVDGELYHTSNKGVPGDSMYIIFTLAVGGVWPGSPNDDTIFPSSLAIDYIRIYKQI